MQKKIKIGLPKGSLEESTFDLFRRAGFHLRIAARNYFPTIDDPEIEVILFRAQELSRYVEDGIIDAGLTGRDWICENNSDVIAVCELVYSKATAKSAHWVLAVPNESKIKKIEDLKGGIVATELVNYTKEYFTKKNIKVKVEFSWGATEAKPPELADAIVELTETGSSLKANNLKIIDTVLESNTVVIANQDCLKDPWKKEKLNNLILLLQGALIAETLVGLKMNVMKSRLRSVLKILPALQTPSISELSNEAWVDVDTIIEEKVVRDLVPKLKKAGAQGIVEYPLNKVIF